MALGKIATALISYVYAQFLRLGREGYTKIMQNLGLVAKRLQKGIEDTGAHVSPALMFRQVCFALIVMQPSFQFQRRSVTLGTGQLKKFTRAPSRVAIIVFAAFAARQHISFDATVCVQYFARFFAGRP